MHRATFGDSDAAVFCARFSHDDRYLATGYGDGLTRIYNLATGKLSYTLQSFDSDEATLARCLDGSPGAYYLSAASAAARPSARPPAIQDRSIPR